jgi:hypothetical protein
LDGHGGVVQPAVRFVGKNNLFAAVTESDSSSGGALEIEGAMEQLGAGGGGGSGQGLAV